MRSNTALTTKMTLKQKSTLDMLERDMLYNHCIFFKSLAATTENCKAFL